MRRRLALMVMCASVCGGCIQAGPDDEQVETAEQEFFVQPQPHGFLFRLLPVRAIAPSAARSVPVARSANTATADDDSDDDGGP